MAEPSAEMRVTKMSNRFGGGGNESCFKYTNFEILIKHSTRDDKRQVFFSMSLEFGGRL